MFLTFFAAASAGIYSLFTCFRPKTPLFYKIVVYGFGSYFLGVTYSLLYAKLMPGKGGFHPGYLGYLGTYFFLFSSYFGALDRLADGHEKVYRPYRLAALLPAAAVLFAGVYQWQRNGELLPCLMLIPAAGTVYFSCKHLILPDVEMGIIRVMRPYNGVITMWCLIQPFVTEMAAGTVFSRILTAANAVLVILAIPLAHKGVRQWFI